MTKPDWQETLSTLKVKLDEEVYLTVNDQLIAYLREHPLSMVGDMVKAFPEQTPSTISARLSQMFARGTIKRELSKEVSAHGKFGFCYWVEDAKAPPAPKPKPEGPVTRLGDLDATPIEPQPEPEPEPSLDEPAPEPERREARMRGPGPAGITARDYVVQSIVAAGDAGANSTDLTANRPEGMSPTAVSPALLDLFTKGAVRREADIAPSGRLFYRYWVQDASRLPSAWKGEIRRHRRKEPKVKKEPTMPYTQPATHDNFSHELDAILNRADDVPEVQPPGYREGDRPPEPLTVQRAQEAVAAMSRAVEQTRPMPTEIMLQVPAGDKLYTMSIGRARAVYDQLKLLFG